MPLPGSPLSERALKYLVVPDSTSSDALLDVLTDVFPDDPEIAEKYSTPQAFNCLIDWVSGDERWRTVAIVTGLGLSGEEFTREEVAELCGRKLSYVVSALQQNNPLSFVRVLHAAHRRIECIDGLPKNELRALGLKSKVWTALAAGGVHTVAELREWIDTRLFTIRGVGDVRVNEIKAILQDK